MDLWRWKLFTGEIDNTNMNKEWWNLRRNLQVGTVAIEYHSFTFHAYVPRVLMHQPRGPKMTLILAQSTTSLQTFRTLGTTPFLHLSLHDSLVCRNPIHFFFLLGTLSALLCNFNSTKLCARIQANLTKRISRSPFISVILAWEKKRLENLLGK